MRWAARLSYTLYNFLIRKGVIKVFKLLLPIYIYDYTYNSTYNSYLYLLLWSPPLAKHISILIPTLIPIFTLTLPFSSITTTLYILYSTTFLEFYTLLGDLVFNNLLEQLYLLKGLNSNIESREEIEDKVLISLRGD